MLKRNIKILPAYDYILNDKKNAKYGRGCANIVFEVIGENGGISFKAFTEWWLPETLKQIPDIGMNNVWARMLSIHSKKELSEDIDAFFVGNCDDCKYTKGECYYYATTPSHEAELIDILIRQGSDKLFEKLEEEYDKYLR